MLFSEENYKFMFAALQEAEQALIRNEVPIGAVVVHEKKVIGRGYNQTLSLNDPTAHAEMIAFTAASNYLGSDKLSQTDLYVTVEPCLMCAGAALLSRINTIYFSIYEPKFGACGSIYNVVEEKKYNHHIKVYSGIYASESKNLLKEFFKSKRNPKN